MQKKSKKKSSTEKSRLPLYLSLTLVAVITSSYFIFPEVENFFSEAWNVLTSDDEQKIKQWVDGFGWLGPIVLIMAMIVQMFLLVIPTILLMVVCVLAYGPVWGSLLVFAAVFSASTVGYFIGQYFGHGLVDRLIGEKSEKKVTGFLEAYGFWAIAITRLNPFLSNDAVSLVAGILNMSYFKFMGATLLGIAPLTVFIAVIGESTDHLKSGLLWGSIVSLCFFGVYVWWDKNRRS